MRDLKKLAIGMTLVGALINQAAAGDKSFKLPKRDSQVTTAAASGPVNNRVQQVSDEQLQFILPANQQQAGRPVVPAVPTAQRQTVQRQHPTPVDLNAGYGAYQMAPRPYVASPVTYQQQPIAQRQAYGFVGHQYPQTNAALYPSPVPTVPIQAGATAITNQAFHPHEFLYPHEYRAIYPPYYYKVRGSWFVTPFGVWSKDRWELQGTEVKVKYSSKRPGLGSLFERLSY